MRGKKKVEPKIFYSFSLDATVPKDHLLRRLASVIDFGFVSHRTRDLYYHAGPESVDPVVVVKVLLLDFLHNIGSVRETMRQCADRMSFRWFLGYDIDEPLPTHSAISKNVKRFGPELFQELFDETVRLCGKHGLIGGRLVHVDSTPVKANASDDSVRLKTDDETFHPDLAPREYWDRVKKETALAHPNVNDRMASATDPEAGIISRDGNGRMLAYKDHRAVDDKHGVILVTEATSAAVTDDTQFPVMVDDLIFHQGIFPDGIAADRIYGRVENYKHLFERGITPYIRRVRSPRQKGQYGKEQFRYDAGRDVYVCPEGQLLRQQGSLHQNQYLYRASKPVCAVCPVRSACATGKGPRTITRHHEEKYVEWALADSHTLYFADQLRRRMHVAEGSFAEAKNAHGHQRTRWRGRWKMQAQCYLVAAIQNLKKLLKWAWKDAETGGKRLTLSLSLRKNTEQYLNKLLLPPCSREMSRFLDEITRKSIVKEPVWSQ